MKMFIAMIGLAMSVAFPASAGTIERVGAHVVGEATFVPAVMFVSGGESTTITTDKYAKGRDLGDVVIVSSTEFDPTDMKSSVAFARSHFGEAAFPAGIGGSVNNWDVGVDGIRGTADDVIDRDNDRF